jgi:hypothetical protein
MVPEKHAPGLLGAAFLTVVLTSGIAGMLLSTAVGSGSISEMLTRISNNLTLLVISNLVDLVTSLGIVVLAVLLYVVLNKENKIIALIALGWWLAEAMFLAISKIAAFALIPLSLEFVKAGAPEHSYFQTLGELVYYGVYGPSYTSHMWFYCFGGILWYYVFYTSRYIPRAISLFGLIAVAVALVGDVVKFFGYDVSIFVFLPILPFELSIGAWLLLRGIKEGSEAGLPLAHASETI